MAAISFQMHKNSLLFLWPHRSQGLYISQKASKRPPYVPTRMFWRYRKKRSLRLKREGKNRHVKIARYISHRVSNGSKNSIHGQSLGKVFSPIFPLLPSLSRVLCGQRRQDFFSYSCKIFFGMAWWWLPHILGEKKDAKFFFGVWKSKDFLSKVKCQKVFINLGIFSRREFHYFDDGKWRHSEILTRIGEKSFVPLVKKCTFYSAHENAAVKMPKISPSPTLKNAFLVSKIRSQR